MLPENLRPVPGDDMGNNIKWDALVADSELYIRTGNYSALRDVRMMQGRFVELDGKPEYALLYYCMVFYADLNGFSSTRQFLRCKDSGFIGWKSFCRIDPGIINKIFHIVNRLDLPDSALTATCDRAFTPALYCCHLFTIKECKEILILARDGNIGKINSMISAAERNLIRIAV